MERTLVIFKPDAIQRGYMGEILARFEKAGLKIIGMKMMKPDKEHYFHHYETIGKMVSRRGQNQFDVQLAAMNVGPVIASVFEGVEAVSLVRKMVGATNTKEAAPGTIRGDFAHASLDYVNAHNLAISTLVHASGDLDDASAEIPHWFKDDELFADYRTVHEVFTQPSPKV